MLSTPPAFVLSQDQTLHEIWKADIGSRFSFGPIYCYISKEIADCYMFIVIDVLRCVRILTSGFTSWLHDVLHCLVFKEHPRFLQSVLPALSWISFYILPHPFRLVKNFLNFFRRFSAPSGCDCRRLRARGCLPPTCNILHGSALSVKDFFKEPLMADCIIKLNT